MRAVKSTTDVQPGQISKNIEKAMFELALAAVSDHVPEIDYQDLGDAMNGFHSEVQRAITGMVVRAQEKVPSANKEPMSSLVSRFAFGSLVPSQTAVILHKFVMEAEDPMEREVLLCVAVAFDLWFGFPTNPSSAEFASQISQLNPSALSLACRAAYGPSTGIQARALVQLTSRYDFRQWLGRIKIHSAWRSAAQQSLLAADILRSLKNKADKYSAWPAFVVLAVCLLLLIACLLPRTSKPPVVSTSQETVTPESIPTYDGNELPKLLADQRMVILGPTLADAKSDSVLKAMLMSALQGKAEHSVHLVDFSATGGGALVPPDVLCSDSKVNCWLGVLGRCGLVDTPYALVYRVLDQTGSHIRLSLSVVKLPQTPFAKDAKVLERVAQGAALDIVWTDVATLYLPGVSTAQVSPSLGALYGDNLQEASEKQLLIAEIVRSYQPDVTSNLVSAALFVKAKVDDPLHRQLAIDRLRAAAAMHADTRVLRLLASLESAENYSKLLINNPELARDGELVEYSKLDAANKQARLLRWIDDILNSVNN